MTSHVMNCPKCGGIMEYRLGEYECTRCRLVLRQRVEEEKPQKPRVLEKRTVERYSSSTLGSPSTQQYNERMMENQYAIHRKYKDPIELEKRLLFWISTGLMSAYVLYLLISKLWHSFNLGRDLLRLSPYIIGLAVIVALLWLMLFTNAIWLKWSIFILGAAFLSLVVLGGLYYGSKLPQTFWSGQSYFDSASYTRMSILFWTGLLLACGCQFWYLSVIWRDIQFNRQWNMGDRG